jgi:hypothetical protein
MESRGPRTPIAISLPVAPASSLPSAVGPRSPIAISFICALLTAVAIFVAGCEKKADPVASLRIFFEQIAAGKTQQAYEETAFGFQAGQNEKSFEAVVHDLGLLEYQSLQSDSPAIEGDSASLRVEITTRAGGKLPFVVTMTNETGAWRVFTIRSPRSSQTGVVGENRFTIVGKAAPIAGLATAEPPEEKELRRLIRENLLGFDQAVADRSFKAFYQTLSARWKDQLTEGQLERAFQPFIEHQFRVSGVANTEAVLDRPPVLDSEGTLIVSGYYPTQPFKTIFSLKFIYEMPKWKLFGIDVNLQK